MLSKFLVESKVWAPQYGRFKHFSFTKLAKGHGAKRKQQRKAQRAARKGNKT